MNWIDQMIQEGKYPQFKRECDKAHSDGASDYEFEGQFVLTKFAKYVCEYVDMHKTTKGIADEELMQQDT